MKRLCLILCVALLLQMCLASCGTAPDDTSDISDVQSESEASAPESDDAPDDTDTSSSPDDSTSAGNTANVTSKHSNPSVTSKTSQADASSKKSTGTGQSSNVSRTTVTSNSTDSGTSAPAEETELAKSIKGFLNVAPRVQYYDDYNPTVTEWANIKAITFDGVTVGGKKTKVFAYIGFPDGASASNKVPAVVLVHGGGGRAFAEWVKKWNDKGYAAIAFDTYGYFPSESGKGVAGREGENASLWQFGLYGPFAEAGYASIPWPAGMVTEATYVYERQWMYRSVVSSVIAHNILLSDSRVDTGKIGITGISWGGVITAIAIGYDTRYAFAVPVYGSGYLDESMTYFYQQFSDPNVKELWSAADRFDKVTCPTLWMAWASDTAFSINTNSKSYLAVKKAGGIFSIRQNWGHSHTSGSAPDEIYRFADSVCRGGGGLVTCTTEPSGGNVSFYIKKPADATAVQAKAYYLTKKLSYSVKGVGTGDPTPDQSQSDWHTVDCTVKGSRVTCTLPDDAVQYYVEITAYLPKQTLVTTTSLVTK